MLVEDETDYTFEYDLNGAMTYDGKNRVTLTRNILGQPYLLEQAGGACVEFSYLADGTKRYMVADTFEGPQYYGSFIYRYDEAAGETFLESIAHPEGRFAVTSYTSQDEPVYSNLHYVTDRVGSVVAVVSLDDVEDEGTDAVLEGNGYTPFGERFAIGGFPKMHLNRFRFNGKEDMSRFQLPYIDYGARYYDPTVARWHRPDPMADKYPDTSPYAFCANDPVNFVDPRGDSLMICNLSILLAIFAGLPDGQHIFISLNKGIVDPSTLDSSSDDFFMQDLYEIATSPEMVELSLSRDYLEKNESGLTIVSFKEAPVDYDDAIDLNDPSYFLPEGVIALGKHVKGNTGRSLFPVPSPSMSPNNNIHVIINSSSNNYKHQAVGLAHEFSHVILYLRGLPYRHDMGGPADVFIYNRAKMMSRRLGYDN